MTGLELIKPDWPAPDHIVAFTTTRKGGVSEGCYQGLNIGDHVEDQPEHVEANRQLLYSQCPGLEQVQWLEQIHSTLVAMAGDDVRPKADASISRQKGIASAVMTADCLPLLVCSQQGDEVAAIHAGWRGLLNGVIESTIKAIRTPPQALFVWLGPAISAAHFEVGPELRDQFITVNASAEQAFTASIQTPGHYMADLYRLARQRLQGLGVEQIYGGEYCTFADQERFYSYRRDGVTGRMVSLIYSK